VITAISRRGKFIIFNEADESLFHLHLRMTGKIVLEQPDKYRAAFHFENGSLYFCDPRRFGTIELGHVPSHLGLEPFSSELTPDLLHQMLQKTNKSIKAFLLDQTKIAGLGNIYTDECLFLTGLHPLTCTRNINLETAAQLLCNILFVLEKGIENCGTSLGDTRFNYYSTANSRGRNQDKLLVFRNDGAPCPHCGTIILKIKAAGRGTHFCPQCQPQP
jgi:formamidopyrimidine-DNA glycosylase